MSETLEETGTAPAAVDLSNLSDARIDDQEGFSGSLVKLLDAAKAAVREAKRYTGAVKALAEARVEIRSFIIRSNGFPDWAASSDAYSIAVQTAETSILAPLGPDAARRLNQAVRQHVKRNYLLPGIVNFILTHGNIPAKLEEDAAKWNAGDRDSVLTGPSEALTREVRKHYKASELNVPDGPFQESHEGSTGGGGGPEASDPPSALNALYQALGGLGSITPRYAVVGLLRTSSDVSKALLAGKTTIQDRPKVIANLHRVATICTTTAKYLEGKADEKDTAAMEAAYFSEEADAIQE